MAGGNLESDNWQGLEAKPKGLLRKLLLSPRYVDTREQTRIPPLVRAGFEARRLDSGDVCFPESGGETVGIETKRLYQLVDDMFTGTLSRQCRRVTEMYKFPIFMAEGHWTREPRTGNLVGTAGRTCTWEAIWNELQSLQDLGMRLQLTVSPEHTIARVLELAEYYAKGIHSSIQRQVAGDVRVAVLSMINGMAAKKSMALLVAMPSLAQIAEATVEQLMDVDGFGPVQAKRIYAFWR